MFPVLEADLVEVDRVIRSRLSSEVALVNTVADYIIAATLYESATSLTVTVLRGSSTITLYYDII